MKSHPSAGKPAPPEALIDVDALQRAYYELKPDTSDPNQLVSFGTSGHRGSASAATFNEAHILAITQAVCEYRRNAGIDGPLMLGKDSHALSAPAERSALEVLGANDVNVLVQQNDGMTPTPVISHAILKHNDGRKEQLADGIVVTPSHNPPSDGGIKYNPPNGGPADTMITGWIENRANELLRSNIAGVQRREVERSLASGQIKQYDFVAPYVDDLSTVVDVEAIRSAGIKIGVDPLGGAAVSYWEPIAVRFNLNIEIVNKTVDPTFRFMTLDHDGLIRMDCSSPFAMARLVQLKDQFDIAFGNDPDADRHGIVTRSAGLLNPNHYLAVAVQHLLDTREQWPASLQVGKTVVTSNLIDRVVAASGRGLFEVPVGFKWFVDPLLQGSICFGGEESAGASFLKRNGRVWTTEKDGIIMGLLAAEILARTGKDPGEHFRETVEKYGTPYYQRIDAPATPAQKTALKRLSAEGVNVSELAGEKIIAILTEAPGNSAPIGGIKVVAANGWFAARPSGTENIYKLYAESFKSESHLELIIETAQQIVNRSLAAAARQ